MAPEKKSPNWTRELVAAESARIKERLLGLGGDRELRLTSCLEEIEKLGDTPKSSTSLERFVYIINALMLGETTLNLSPSQISTLTKLAEGILLSNGVAPTTSRQSFLYGYLHIALARLHRRNGSLWKAVWSQQIAYQRSRRAPLGEDGHFAYYMGISASYFGFSDIQSEWIEQLTSENIPQREQTRLALEQIRLMRISGDLEKSKSAVDKLKSSSTDPQILRELEWEAFCREAQQTGDPKKLILSVRKKQSHHDPEYLFEAFLWIRAVGSKRYLKDYPTFSKLANLTETLKGRRYLLHRRCVQTLEKLYDTTYPLNHRLELAGELFEVRDKFPSLDLSLLIRACTIRWLARHSALALASMVLREYEATNFGMTRGEQSDCMNLVSDLKPQEWIARSADIKKAA